MRKQGILTEKDHQNLSATLGHILDDYKKGVTTKEHAVEAIAHGITALDEGEDQELLMFLEQGRKLARR